MVVVVAHVNYCPMDPWPTVLSWTATADPMGIFENTG